MSSGGQHNEFLRQFLQARKHHLKEAASRPEPTTAAGKMKERGKTAQPIEDGMAENTLASIIEKKPGKKVVMEYFQQMAERLTTAKMK